jgi:membrane protein
MIVRGMHVVLSRAVRRTISSVLDHDCLNMAQSTAYSAIVALFPALIVAAAVIDLLPDTAPLRFQLSIFFSRILPPDVSPLLDAYFSTSTKNVHSARVLLGAVFVSIAGASNVMTTMMDGMRRAYDLPTDCWTFWGRRVRAFLLVPLSLLPLAIASLLVVFGHALTEWLAPSLSPIIRPSVYAFAVLARWTIALAASVGLIAVIYTLGLPPGAVERRGRSAWSLMLPGAVVATAMWFLTTLVFGWYVTRFANYSAVYGSLGVGIALLFWLYIISLSVLCGAEFNAHYHVLSNTRARRGAKTETEPAP